MTTEKNKITWAILCTGWGRNAKDILKEHFKKNALSCSEFPVLIYEDDPCGAATYAKTKGVAVYQVKRSSFSSLESYQQHLLKLLAPYKVNFVFMLNFKYLLKQAFLSTYPDRIINIHPSLFPSFLATKTAVQDALEYGVKITGITTHIIDDKFDRGIILRQKAIRIPDGSTFDSLYPKFRKKGKKIILETIELIENTELKTFQKNG